MQRFMGLFLGYQPTTPPDPTFLLVDGEKLPGNLQKDQKPYFFEAEHWSRLRDIVNGFFSSEYTEIMSYEPAWNALRTLIDKHVTKLSRVL
ncbi:MAG: hypothetical protein IPJ88_04815 [Myxococcales bacterium]|nr:MAG: hypothetical protein IPJ88_04815 [Myxococcales bacterium]